MSSTALPDDSTNRPDILDWFVRIRTDRSALGMSYTVLLFLGEPPADESKWRSSENVVGYHSVFVSSHVEDGGYGAQEGGVSQGFVHINEKLEKRRILSQPEAEIEAYIRNKLHWRIQKIDGTVVPAEDVANLEVAVMTVVLRWNTEDEIYEVPPGVRPIHRNLTSGRPGGREPGTD